MKTKTNRLQRTILTTLIPVALLQAVSGAPSQLVGLRQQVGSESARLIIIAPDAPPTPTGGTYRALGDITLPAGVGVGGNIAGLTDSAAGGLWLAYRNSNGKIALREYTGAGTPQQATGVFADAAEGPLVDTVLSVQRIGSKIYVLAKKYMDTAVTDYRTTPASQTVAPILRNVFAIFDTTTGWEANLLPLVKSNGASEIGYSFNASGTLVHAGGGYLSDGPNMGVLTKRDADGSRRWRGGSGFLAGRCADWRGD